MHAAVCLLRAGQPRSTGDAAKLGQFIGQFSWVTGHPIGLKGLIIITTVLKWNEPFSKESFSKASSYKWVLRIVIVCPYPKWWWSPLWFSALSWCTSRWKIYRNAQQATRSIITGGICLRTVHRVPVRCTQEMSNDIMPELWRTPLCQNFGEHLKCYYLGGYQPTLVLTTWGWVPTNLDTYLLTYLGLGTYPPWYLPTWHWLGTYLSTYISSTYLCTYLPGVGYLSL